MRTLSGDSAAVKPDSVINCAGLTGRPNVDWCEDHKTDVVRVNVMGTLGLLDACHQAGIHCCNVATGCIYDFDEAHPVGEFLFQEDTKPNYKGSFYSVTKTIVDQLVHIYDQTLHLRVRMPITADGNPRCLLSKLRRYPKLIDVPNSVSVLPDLLPAMVAMVERRITGTFNFTNPGTMSHNEMMGLYKEHVDPSHEFTNFTIEEQNKILKCGRCNCGLDVSKLLAAVPDVPILPVREAMAAALKANADKFRAEVARIKAEEGH